MFLIHSIALSINFNTYIWVNGKDYHTDFAKTQYKTMDVKIHMEILQQ